MLFVLCSIIFSSVGYDFYSVGQYTEEETSSKKSGTISLKAVHYSQYYNGQLAYTLSKKVLLGYSIVSRQQIDTYGKTVDVAYWYNCANAKYKGTLLLNIADSNYSKIYGTFSVQ